MLPARQRSGTPLWPFAIATCNSVCRVVIDKNKRPALRAQVECEVVAAPLFITAFTAIGAKRPGYDCRRHTVSSLATGYREWQQRANFGLAGVLFFIAARGLGRCPRRSIGPRVVQRWLRLPASV